MTTINHSKLPSGNTRTLLIQWEALANGDDGTPVPFSQYTDKSVQVVGTFGVGGSVRLEGSNNGTDWATLTDAQGNDLNISAPKIEMVLEATQYIRPRVTAGDGSTSLTVVLLMKE
jgi:hypothetical protein